MSAIAYPLREGYPPIRVSGHGLAGGGCVFEDAKSSQYISAILMAAPYAAEDVTVQLLGPITSEPYITMTLRMMEQFGVRAQVHDQCGTRASRAIRIPHGQKYAPREYAIEPDASNASYFLAAAAIVPGASVTIEALGTKSLQGDAGFAAVLEKMGAAVKITEQAITVTGTGVLRGIDLDMNAMPDMVQTLAVVALFADGPSTARNVWNLRVKETDRLLALETELRKLGATVDTTADRITITPAIAGGLHGASIATYDDHRMAMAFAIARLRIADVIIENPECVGKTYPHYFADLAAAVTH